jgi:hypothetical protein
MKGVGSSADRLVTYSPDFGLKESNVKKSQNSPERSVGIFWLVGRRLLIDGTPLSEAERYGNNLTHPHGHNKVWERFQRKGIVPMDMEYEEAPRGRVLFNTKTQKFTLLADRCILRNKRLVREIMRKLRLPRGTETDTDSHYRCSACLHLDKDE